ncbi:MAG: putative zinc-binding metallopeptidase [Candidatus Omnitrophica bacterium]|nr:putative zinc-binding metallopeptidase [Candidatus Omnitrophota bacterium]
MFSKNHPQTPHQPLLHKKISSFNLSLKSSALEPMIQKLYRELNAKGLTFRPKCFVADEWFCPVNIPAIGIPFYLLNTELSDIEDEWFGEVEGGTKEWFMKLIRHEAGHCYSYAYKLYRKKRWQNNFGIASADYPDTYQIKPYSKSFVRHLDNHYAQSHPDEDFAETFAVWLTPGSKWKTAYRGWPAYRKLQYIDELMKSITYTKPVHNPEFDADDYSGLDIKLISYLRKKRLMYAHQLPGYYDKELKKIFTPLERHRRAVKASLFIKKHRRRILASTAEWTRQSKKTISALLNNISARCDTLNLSASEDDFDTNTRLSAFITSQVMHYAYTGKLGAE